MSHDLQSPNKVFRNAKLAKREGVSVGHFVDTSFKVFFNSTLIILSNPTNNDIHIHCCTEMNYIYINL